VHKKSRVPLVKWAGESGGIVGGKGCCPYFRISGNRSNADGPQTEGPLAVDKFSCPFYEAGESKSGGASKKRNEVRELYEVCCADRKHREGAAKHVHSTPWYKNAMVRVGSLLSRVHPGVPKTK